MKAWKAVLGLGAACAACCAIPLLGLAGGIGAVGAFLAACASELWLLVGLLLALGAGLAGMGWWRRRLGAAASRAACHCESACQPGGACSPAAGVGRV